MSERRRGRLAVLGVFGFRIEHRRFLDKTPQVPYNFAMIMAV
jgi:hypothetical protein